MKKHIINQQVMLLFITVFGLASTTIADSHTQQLLEMGKQLSLACQSCHGFGNNGKNATPYVPKITGQHKEYTIAQLKAYRNGTRKGGMAAHMKIAASIFEEEQYEAIALYLESLRED